jgi:hypothetical protein
LFKMKEDYANCKKKVFNFDKTKTFFRAFEERISPCTE